MNLKLSLSLLSEDFQHGLNNIPDTGGLGGGGGADYTGSFYGFAISKETFAEIGRWVNLLNILLVIMIIWGVIHVVISIIGNNGKWRKAGSSIALTGYGLLLFIHVAIIAGCASRQLVDGKLIIFILIILSQLVFYIGAPMLFMLGSEWQMMAEMTERPQYIRQATRAYGSITALMGFGAVVYLIGELM